MVSAPPDAARDLARALVERRVAACANVLDPIQSFFWWEGRVQDEPEALLILKTRSDRFEALRAAVEELHPYDVPEVIAVPVDAALKTYAAWVHREVEPEP